MSTFGERLRKWRKDKGVSTYQLEKEADMDRSTLRQIEKGLRPASETDMDKILSCKALGLNKEKLIAWQRIDGLTKEQAIHLLETLMTDEELKPLIKRALNQKRQADSHPSEE